MPDPCLVQFFQGRGMSVDVDSLDTIDQVAEYFMGISENVITEEA